MMESSESDTDEDRISENDDYSSDPAENEVDDEGDTSWCTECSAYIPRARFTSHLQLCLNFPSFKRSTRTLATSTYCELSEDEGSNERTPHTIQEQLQEEESEEEFECPWATKKSRKKQETKKKQTCAKPRRKPSQKRKVKKESEEEFENPCAIKKPRKKKQPKQQHWTCSDELQQPVSDVELESPWSKKKFAKVQQKQINEWIFAEREAGQKWFRRKTQNKYIIVQNNKSSDIAPTDDFKDKQLEFDLVGHLPQKVNDDEKENIIPGGVNVPLQTFNMEEVTTQENEPTREHGQPGSSTLGGTSNKHTEDRSMTEILYDRKITRMCPGVEWNLHPSQDLRNKYINESTYSEAISEDEDQVQPEKRPEELVYEEEDMEPLDLSCKTLVPMVTTCRSKQNAQEQISQSVQNQPDCTKMETKPNDPKNTYESLKVYFAKGPESSDGKDGDEKILKKPTITVLQNILLQPRYSISEIDEGQDSEPHSKETPKSQETEDQGQDSEPHSKETPKSLETEDESQESDLDSEETSKSYETEDESQESDLDSDETSKSQETEDEGQESASNLLMNVSQKTGKINIAEIERNASETILDTETMSPDTEDEDRDYQPDSKETPKSLETEDESQESDLDSEETSKSQDTEDKSQESDLDSEETSKSYETEDESQESDLDSDETSKSQETEGEGQESASNLLMNVSQKTGKINIAEIERNASETILDTETMSPDTEDEDRDYQPDSKETPKSLETEDESQESDLDSEETSKSQDTEDKSQESDLDSEETSKSYETEDESQESDLDSDETSKSQETEGEGQESASNLLMNVSQKTGKINIAEIERNASETILDTETMSPDTENEGRDYQPDSKETPKSVETEDESQESDLDSEETSKSRETDDESQESDLDSEETSKSYETEDESQESDLDSDETSKSQETEGEGQESASNLLMNVSQKTGNVNQESQESDLDSEEISKSQETEDEGQDSKETSKHSVQNRWPPMWKYKDMEMRYCPNKNEIELQASETILDTETKSHETEDEGQDSVPHSKETKKHSVRNCRPPMLKYKDMEMRYCPNKNEIELQASETILDTETKSHETEDEGQDSVPHSNDTKKHSVRNRRPPMWKYKDMEINYYPHKNHSEVKTNQTEEHQTVKTVHSVTEINVITAESNDDKEVGGCFLEKPSSDLLMYTKTTRDLLNIELEALETMPHSKIKSQETEHEGQDTAMDSKETSKHSVQYRRPPMWKYKNMEMHSPNKNEIELQASETILDTETKSHETEDEGQDSEPHSKETKKRSVRSRRPPMWKYKDMEINYWPKNKQSKQLVSNDNENKNSEKQNEDVERQHPAGPVEETDIDMEESQTEEVERKRKNSCSQTNNPKKRRINQKPCSVTKLQEELKLLKSKAKVERMALLKKCNYFQMEQEDLKRKCSNMAVAHKNLVNQVNELKKELQRPNHPVPPDTQPLLEEEIAEQDRTKKTLTGQTVDKQRGPIDSDEHVPPVQATPTLLETPIFKCKDMEINFCPTTEDENSENETNVVDEQPVGYNEKENGKPSTSVEERDIDIEETERGEVEKDHAVKFWQTRTPRKQQDVTKDTEKLVGLVDPAEHTPPVEPATSLLAASTKIDGTSNRGRLQRRQRMTQRCLCCQDE